MVVMQDSIQSAGLSTLDSLVLLKELSSDKSVKVLTLLSL